jgi:hypothetical protein
VRRNRRLEGQVRTLPDQSPRRGAEFRMSILDKPLESVFGYITVATWRVERIQVYRAAE